MIKREGWLDSSAEYLNDACGIDITVSQIETLGIAVLVTVLMLFLGLVLIQVICKLFTGGWMD